MVYHPNVFLDKDLAKIIFLGMFIEHLILQ